MNSAPTPTGTLATEPASAADFEELLELRIAAMRESLERLGRFDPERARERLRATFRPDHTRFILLNGRRIGFYTFRPIDDGFRLDHLYLHPDFQSRGLGSRVLHQLLAHADAQGAQVRVSALKESSSNRFYLRHGFVQSSQGEWDIDYVRIARDPSITQLPSPTST